MEQYQSRSDRPRRGATAARRSGCSPEGWLILGAAARTDLLGADRAIELVHVQYGSLQRLAALPDTTLVWPTHGAGSFCSAPPGAERTSTIGAEKATNAAGRTRRGHVRTPAHGSLGSYPAYFAWLAEANRQGPRSCPGNPCWRA